MGNKRKYIAARLRLTDVHDGTLRELEHFSVPEALAEGLRTAVEDWYNAAQAALDAHYEDAGK